MLLTLTALWMESKSYERLIVVCINFICHLLCIQSLQWTLPHNGQAAPYIRKYPIIINITPDKYIKNGLKIKKLIELI